MVAKTAFGLYCHFLEVAADCRWIRASENARMRTSSFALEQEFSRARTEGKPIVIKWAAMYRADPRGRISPGTKCRIQCEDVFLPEAYCARWLRLHMYAATADTCSADS
jgi:hypothetical protein